MAKFGTEFGRFRPGINRPQVWAQPFPPSRVLKPPYAVPVPGPVPVNTQRERGKGVNILLGALTLMLTVPVAELLIVYLHAQLELVVIDELLLTFALVTSGHMGEFWKSSAAKPWVGALVLFSLAAAFGDIKGISIPFIFQYDLRFHILPFYFCALALTARQIGSILSWTGWGSLVLLGLCAVFGVVKEDRFSIPNTSLENPNDLAFNLLFTMSCLVLLNSKKSRIIALLSCPLFVYYILKTGSRANLITLLVMLLVMFVVSPGRTRVTIIVGSGLAAAVMIAVVPSATLQRITLIVSDPTKVHVADHQLEGAIDSQAARVELQKDAISLTLHHPVLGVGANTFEMSVAQMVMQETGKKSGWQGAHNSYLQISAENGIPAFLCYLASLLACCSMNFRIFMRCRREAALAGYMPQSLALILMTIAFAVGIVFSNNAYSPALCVLVGMSSANYLAIQRERSAPLQQFSVTALPDSRRPQPVTARTLKAPLIR